MDKQSQMPHECVYIYIKYMLPILIFVNTLYYISIYL